MTLSPGPRAVAWGGLHNARDLGGLPLIAGGTTAAGVLYRAPRLDSLGARGWDELLAAGVVRLVDLRNDVEIAELRSRPASLEVLVRSIEDQSDEEFMERWGRSLGSPAYYPEVLRRWPELVAEAVSALDLDGPGAVVVHCGAGRDRTGMVAALILDAAGVERAAILDDYELGVREYNDHLLASTATSERPRVGLALDDAIVLARREVDEFLDGAELRALLAGQPQGVAPLDRVVARLTGRAPR